MKKLLILALGLGLLVAGCGKVSKSPVAPLVDPPVYNNFDSGLNGWGWCYAKFNGTGYSSAASMPASLAGADAVTLGNAHTYGNSPGAAQIHVYFGSAGDSFDMGYQYSSDTNVGFGDKVLSAWIYWESGLTVPSGKVVAKFYEKATNQYTYSSGPDATLVQGRWIQVTWAPAGIADLDKIREWGIELYGSTGPFTPGVVYLDNVSF